VFLNRGVRTVQRWERDEGLPVHRHNHSKRGTVSAVASEIETWMKARKMLNEVAVEPLGRAFSYPNMTNEELQRRCIAARDRAQYARNRVRQVYEYYQNKISRVLEVLNAGGPTQ